MPYKAAKISFDGSHYIATPKENFPQGGRRRKTRPLPDAELDKKEQFETAYTESKKLPRKERKTFLLDALKDTIPDKAQREEFIAQHTERKKINAIRRKRGRRPARNRYPLLLMLFHTYLYGLYTGRHIKRRHVQFFNFRSSRRFRSIYSVGQRIRFTYCIFFINFILKIYIKTNHYIKYSLICSSRKKVSF